MSHMDLIVLAATFFVIGYCTRGLQVCLREIKAKRKASKLLD